MTHGFDQDHWESHWRQASAHGVGRQIAPDPHLAGEVGGLVSGTALDAGCGEGAEAIWLAAHGSQVTAVDISTEALARATESATRQRVRWLVADLGVWEPGEQFDLVTTHYAHPAMPQLAFYDRLSGWVAPRGSLLLVGHRHTHGQQNHGRPDDGHRDGGHPPGRASVTAAGVTAVLDSAVWLQNFGHCTGTREVSRGRPVRTSTSGTCRLRRVRRSRRRRTW
ncbi:MAG: SAM-dependent methyltransferase [Modestobacter sp.]|nr:SAM-dependent methyltransferase [Modestobacter sp.]